MFQLRDDQEAAITALRKSIAAGNRRIMLQAATGYGKTVLAAEIVRRARSQGRRVAFICPATGLIDQTIDKFRAHGIEGVAAMQGDHPETDWFAPVQVATWQSFIRRNRADHFWDAGLIIIDEAHRRSEALEAWITEGFYRNVPVIGLSATPWSKGLGRVYSDLVVAGTMQDMMERGVLSPYRAFAPSHPDVSGVKIRNGDFAEGDLSHVMQDATLVASLVDEYRKAGSPKKTLVFCVDRAHAAKVHDEFARAGYAVAYQDAHTPDDDRRRIAGRFEGGELDAVINIATLTTGVDWDVRCIILARPTRSEMLFVQIIGRGLRTAEGKEYCLILDHSDTFLRLGFPEDIHKPELCSGKKDRSASKEREEAMPKECPSCGYVKPPRVSICPECGFKAQKQSTVEAAQGDLKEITEPQKIDKNASMDVKREWYAQLMGYAKSKGYKRGWAAHKYREKFGVWPSGMKDVKPKPPEGRVLSHIKHLNIKAHKAKEAARLKAWTSGQERAMDARYRQLIE